MLRTEEKGGLQKRKRPLVCDSLFFKATDEDEHFAVLAALLFQWHVLLNVVLFVSVQHSRTKGMKPMPKKIMKLL